MRSPYAIRDGPSAYFITATIVEWLPVFTTAACCDIIVRSLLHCREHKALQIHAWVILDNHFHAILSAPDLASTLTISNALRRVPCWNRSGRETRMAAQSISHCCAAHKRSSEHQVWQEGVHPQVINGDCMMQQKLDYLHNNPVKREYVSAPEHWRYSSAHEWMHGVSPLIKCDPW